MCVCVCISIKTQNNKCKKLLNNVLKVYCFMYEINRDLRKQISSESKSEKNLKS